MLKLLKVCGRGIVTLVLLPIILLVWVMYGVYCLVLFVIMFFKGTIDFFKGKDFSADLIEDIESKRMLLEKEKADEKAKEMLNIMYQNALAQAQLDQPAPVQPSEPQQFEHREYGPDIFNDFVEQTPEENAESSNEEDK